MPQKMANAAEQRGYRSSLSASSSAMILLSFSGGGGAGPEPKNRIVARTCSTYRRQAAQSQRWNRAARRVLTGNDPSRYGVTSSTKSRHFSTNGSFPSVRRHQDLQTSRHAQWHTRLLAISTGPWPDTPWRGHPKAGRPRQAWPQQYWAVRAAVHTG